MNKSEINVGILIYDNVEVLDFCGPFEVFNNADRMVDRVKINVFTVAQTRDTVNAQGLSVNPTFTLTDCPPLDILVIPGGDGIGLMKNEVILNWIKKQASEVPYLTSVCTGALSLGKLGLLDGLRVTTHHMYLDKLREVAPKAIVVDQERYLDNVQVFTAGGISAGIDMSLAICEKLWGLEIKEKIVKYMEYNW